MKGMREIRNRIKAVKSTGQITHAMELVASSKMRKAQMAAEKGRAYATALLDMAESVGAELRKKSGEGIFTPEKNSKRLVITISTDRGLCGSLNSNLFKAVLDINEDCDFISVGLKAERFLLKCGKNLIAKFRVSDRPSFAETRAIAQCAIEQLKGGKARSVEVLYPLFINTLKQETFLVKLAPVDNLHEIVEHLREVYKISEDGSSKDDREITFEPSAEKILEILPDYYLRQSLHHIVLDVKASEQSARMVAMKSASDNADELVRKLTLEYNKARQGAITTEIIELAAGASE